MNPTPACSKPAAWLRAAAWTGVGLWMATIFALSSLSGPQVEKLNVFEIWDKAAHFVAFGAGAALTTLAVRWSTVWSWKKVILVTLGAISVFGALDEWHQLYTPKRSGADPADWAADTLGAAAAIGLVSWFLVRRQIRQNVPSGGPVQP